MICVISNKYDQNYSTLVHYVKHNRVIYIMTGTLNCLMLK
jgi:hypothetical protein